MVLCFEGYCQESEKITTKWEEIFANYVSKKGWIYRIYKEPLQLNNNSNTKTTQFINRQKLEMDIFPEKYTNEQ